ncbi:MAG TPA: DUF748 domain-containing protein [Dissulfurispiraceae bacterium]
MKKLCLRIAAIAAALSVAAIVLSFFIDEPLRRYTERKMNSRLKDYTIHIGKLDFHPIGFSIDLRRMTVVQNADPKPPVADIKDLHMSIHWRELLSGHLVADFRMDNPKLYINLKNVKVEKKSKVPIQKKGWQDALQAAYPFKINVFRIYHGEITYIDVGPYKPLHVTDVTFEAHNIRNIRYRGRVYPSPVRLTGTVFNTGKLMIDGDMDFLAEPHVGLKTAVRLDNMELSYFEPVIRHYNLSVKKGTLSVAGNMEYGPRQTIMDLKSVVIRGADMDYTHLAATAAAEKQRAEKAKQTAKQLSNKPATLLRIGRLELVKCNFGFINATANPRYRVFFSGVNLRLANFSNHFSQGPATLEISGLFMGSGKTSVSGIFRPETHGPDFYVKVAIVRTWMPTMNDIFRAYGNFDVAAGLFSFYSELTVKNNRVSGYVKPLFRSMKVYDRRKDREKSLFHKLYEMLVGGVAKLLENPQKRVVTTAEVKGPVSAPRTSTWQVILRLIENAFFHSILPGFERSIK